MKLYIKKNVKIKNGYVNSAIYDFDKKRIYLVKKDVGDYLTQGKLQSINTKMISSLVGLGVLVRDEKLGEKEPTIFNYELFDDKYSYKKCKLAYMEVADFCNYSCLHCYADIKSGSTKYMKAEKALAYVKQIVAAGDCDIRVTGGEPFLNPELLSIIDCIEKEITPITHHSIVTNGSFDIDKALYVLEKGFEMQISIYGTDEVEFSYFTHASNNVFNKIKDNLELLSQSKYKDQILLLFSVNALSYNSMEKFKEYAKKKGFRYILNRPASVGRAVVNWEELKLPDEKYEAFSRSQRSEKMWLCHHLCQLHWTSIMVNGDVTPCGFLRDEKDVLGNLENNSFLDIWNSKCYVCFRELTSEDVQYCRDCEFRYLCTAGCCGETKAYTKELLKPYVWCKVKPYCNDNYLNIETSEIYEVIKNAAGLFDFKKVGELS